MQAAVIRSPHDLALCDVPTPDPAPGEVLVEVHTCGVCGTDLHILQGEYWGDYPRIPGHEFSGAIAALGDGVTGLRVGDRVAIDPNLPCGRCRCCRRGMVNLCEHNTAVGVTRDGGFAEYCAVPAALALLLPDELPLLAGALAEPVSCCLHGLDRARVRPGDSVVILGAGTIGLIMLQLASHAGAGRVVVVEPRASKRELALQLGAVAALDPVVLGDGLAGEVLHAAGEAVDVAIEAAGREDTAHLALALVSSGGTVLYFGVCPPDAQVMLRPHDVFFHELTVVGSYTNPFTCSRALELLAAGAVQAQPLISHRFALAEAPAAFSLVARGETVKAVVGSLGGAEGSSPSWRRPGI
jgi:2-desacetyl-2-hydroxyethyl bacteriochlorophyllide A dehydrogenase